MLALPAVAQTPARDGVITGQVIDAASAKPVSAALVSIDGTGQSTTGANRTPRILTGADGRFAFSALPTPGSFRVSATKGGYANGAYGMRRPGGASQSIELSSIQPKAEITVRVWKHGAITGTVTDEAGEPLVTVQVRALMRRAGGARPFAGAVASGMTDDRGVYRLGSLLPGDYLVVASQPGFSAPAGLSADLAGTGRGVGELVGLVAGQAQQGLRVGSALYGMPRGTATPPAPAGTRMRTYPPTFHPAAVAAAQAAVVSLGSGEERSSVDIHLTPVTTLRVSGTLMGPSGPAGMAPLRLIPSGGDLMPPEALGAVGVTDASGAFVFPAVVPGNYVLKNEMRESPAVGWIALPIAVAGDDIDGVVATLQPGLRITARLRFDGSAPPPAPEQGRPPPFSLEPEDGSATVSLAAPGATADAVTLVGFAPGRYRVRIAHSPAGWMFKGAMLDGVDVSVTPFDLSRDLTDLELVFTDRWSGVGGTVQGAGADGAVVVLFPTESRAWINAGPNPRRLRSARVDAQGRFGIRSVPPGDYYVVAIPDEQSAEWRDPSVLETLARTATQVTIGDGEHKTLDLRVREVRQ